MIRLERTGRWDWALGAGLVLGAIGVATGEHVLVLAATLPLWYAASAAITGMSVPDLEIERSIERRATAPGEYVPVELTVRNVGEEPVTDLRIVDGVPDELSVPDGVPRACHTLAPGEAATLSYLVSTRRGTFTFDPPRLRLRNLTGTVAVDVRPDVQTAADGGTASDAGRADGRIASGADEEGPTVVCSGDRTIECELPVEAVPLADQTLDRSGRVDADEGGIGIEFHSVREYQRGDPKRAIDWRRYAKTGDLTTVEYNEERATTVVIVVDARDETFVAADEEDPAAVTLTTFAAERTFDALSERGHEVGLTVLSVGRHPVIGPGTGPEIERRAHEELEAVRENQPRWVSLGSRDGERLAASAVARLGNRLSGETQVLFFTPALDDFPEHVCRGLLAHGHETTVVSPDVATADEPGQQVLATERRGRLTRMRGAGARIVDWEQDRPLQLVLADALAGGETV